MTFLYPLGLLGLIGIPLLILIYIIKSKYTEQTVSSTYLWTLSERFLKRKNPISRLTGIISLILQILAVAVISLAIAHPIITVPNSANEYCFILDASASMNMESDGVSRFESGKDRIMDIISDSVDGSVFSLICVGDTTNVIFERLEDKEQAEILLRDVEVAYNADDYTDALGVAQGYFNENSSVLTYLVTDKAYRSNTNISLINVSSDEENYAVSDVTHTFKDGKLTVNGFVTSYRSAATLSLKLYIDESEQPVSGNTVVVKQSVPTAFQITCNTDRFSEYRVAIENEDSLALDNSFIFNDIKSESSYDTLIVSDKPFFIRSAIESLMNARIDVIGTEEYKEQSGYGLYIFDAFVPETLPRDGSVWMLSPEGSVPEAGFSVQDKEELGRGELLEMNGSSASAVKKLTAELSGDGIYVAKYVKCGLYRNFTTVLSYKGNPLLFAGTNSYGNRQVVFAFDLHDSNLPLLLDYLVLTRNLLDYSFPEVVEKSTFTCGDEVAVNVLANCESIRVDSPLGNVSYLNTDGAVGNFVLNEVGEYTVTMTVSGTQRQFNIFSAMIEEERATSVLMDSVALQGEAGGGGFDGRFDPLTLLFIVLAIVFSADWMVYCYEKYQLR